MFGGGKSQAELADENIRASRVPMKLGDLKNYALNDRGDPKKLADAVGMDDDRLLEAINDPDELGSSIVLGDGEIQQGNHRIGEALDRMNNPNNRNFTPETKIWVVP